MSANNNKVGVGALVVLLLSLLGFLAWAPRQNSKAIADQESRIVTLETSQRYIESQLAEIKRSLESLDDKIDRLLETSY